MYVTISLYFVLITLPISFKLPLGLTLFVFNIVNLYIFMFYCHLRFMSINFIILLLKVLMLQFESLHHARYRCIECYWENSSWCFSVYRMYLPPAKQLQWLIFKRLSRAPLLAV